MSVWAGLKLTVCLWLLRKAFRLAWWLLLLLLAAAAAAAWPVTVNGVAAGLQNTG